MTNFTGSLQRKPDGRFLPGHPGMGGRPRGHRNRLTELVTTVLSEDFELHGADTIERVRRDEPGTYLKIIASLMPKMLQTERLSPLADLTDEELTLIEQTLRAGRARVVSEQQNGAANTAIPKSPSTPHGSKA